MVVVDDCCRPGVDCGGIGRVISFFSYFWIIGIVVVIIRIEGYVECCTRTNAAAAAFELLPFFRHLGSIPLHLSSSSLSNNAQYVK